MKANLNGQSFEINGEQSVAEFAALNGEYIPTLCFLKDCSNVAKCGICSVLVNGKKVLACNTPVQENDEIITESEELDDAVQKRLGMLLDKHDFACGKCNRKDNCEFLKLVMKYKARANERYNPSEEERMSKIDSRSSSLTINRNRCVLCSRCVAACKVKSGTESISIGKLPETVGEGRGVCPSIVENFGSESAKPVLSDKCFDETNCLLCGQCSIACPVAAINEKDDIQKVEDALTDSEKVVIIAPAPSIRTALGEMFDLEIGTDVTGKIYSACRELGFDKVWDINFAADVTILEEGTELLQRLGLAEGGHSSKLPLLTSCCPGWMRLVNNFAPELLENVSTTKSPQEIFGAAVKNYYSKVSGIDPKNLFVVTIMPCTAKKYEATLYETAGCPEIDAVLTTREFARFVKAKKIDFVNLPDSDADPIMGEYTGAGTIFGITGGVMEAALRTAKDLADEVDLEEVDYEAVQGFNGVREAEVELTGKKLKVAVINGAANFFEFKKSANLEEYTFIEVMACPGGCINGGGQPHVDSKTKLKEVEVNGHFAGTGNKLPEYIAKRAAVLRNQDKDGIWTDKKRKSHQNVDALKMYEVLETSPATGLAYEIFHTHNLHS